MDLGRRWEPPGRATEGFAVTVMTRTSLSDFRVQAAQSSLGSSSDALYERVASVLQQLRPSGTILDFGAGVGNFTRLLLTRFDFATVLAVDILPVPDDLGSRVEWCQADLNEEMPVRAALVDYIVAVEIIEHLENPRFIAREWFRVIRPGGTVLLSTPNNNSLRALLSIVLKGHFVAFLDSSYPAHITALVITDLRRVLREAGFEKVEVLFSNRGSIPGRPRTLWQNFVGSLRGRWFSDNVIVVGRKPLIDVNDV